MIEDTWFYVCFLFLSFFFFLLHIMSGTSTMLHKAVLHYVCFILLYNLVLKYIILSDGPFGYFHLGPIISKAVTNIFAHIFWWTYILIFLGLVIKLPAYKISNCLALINMVKGLSKMVQSLYIPPANENSAFLSTLAIQLHNWSYASCYSQLGIVNPSWCVAISCFSLKFCLHFPNVELCSTMLNTFSYVYCHLVSLFIKCLFKYFSNKK